MELTACFYGKGAFLGCNRLVFDLQVNRKSEGGEKWAQGKQSKEVEKPLFYNYLDYRKATR